MEDMPLEIKGLIFSYLDDKEILKRMKQSKDCCAEIKKCSKYIALDTLRILDMDDVLYFTGMKVNVMNMFIHISDKDIKLITECIKRIEYISLSAALIFDDGLKYLSNIKTVEMFHCYKITDNGLAHLENVNKIIIYNNNNITNAGVKHLLNIKFIKFANCKNITLEGISEILQDMPDIICNINNIEIKSGTKVYSFTMPVR
jgi:hypothetical protein